MNQHPFRQFEYLTPPEHVHSDHIENAWAQANDRVAARLSAGGG
jgi:hypothetical protein